MSNVDLAELTGIDQNVIPHRLWYAPGFGKGGYRIVGFAERWFRREPMPLDPRLTWYLRPPDPVRRLLNPDLGRARRCAATVGVTLSRGLPFVRMMFIVALFSFFRSDLLSTPVAVLALVAAAASLLLAAWAAKPSVSATKFFESAATGKKYKMQEGSREWAIHLDHLWRRSGDRARFHAVAWKMASALKKEKAPEYRGLVESVAVTSAVEAGVSAPAAHFVLETMSGDIETVAEMAATAFGEDSVKIRRWLRSGAGFIDRRHCKFCGRATNEECVPWL